jgi:TRAP-type C4-dicarboxylate transport system substrate-binding protein
MNSMRRDFIAQGLATGGTIVMAMTLTLATGRAQDKTYVMKFTLPTLNDPSYQFTKNYAAAIERDSAGRIKTEIYPASQLGSIPRQIEGTRNSARFSVRSFRPNSLLAWTNVSR